MRIRKDLEPQETVKRIKHILDRLKLETYLVEEYTTNNMFCSVRIEFTSFLGVGVNGKGVTKEYAMASAYGELMERLENGVLLNSMYPYKERLNETCNINTKMLHNFYEYYNVSEEERKSICSFFELYPYMGKSREYTDVINEKNVLLPSRLIDLLNGTNGLCAGNTFYEAVVQGIQEILERVVLKYIFFRPIKAYNEIKILPLQMYECLEIYELVKEIEKKGYICQFMDCTLGGKIPVIGLILFDAKKTKYKFSLASDVEIEIAIQRCITEIFQGQKVNALFKFSMNPIIDIFQIKDNIYEIKDNYTNFEKSVIAGEGQLPPYFFLIKEEAKQKWNFGGIKNNKQAYVFLQNLIKKLGYKLLILDNSILDFPAYRVVIPGMSELFTDLRYFQQRRLRDECMAGLINYSGNEKKELPSLVKKIQELNKYNCCGDEYGVGNISGIIIEDPQLSYLYANHKILLCILYFQCEEYEKAFEVYSDICGKKDDDGHLLYLKLKSLGCQEETIQKFFLLAGKEWPEKIFFNVKFPQCPDCDVCCLQQQCKYTEWKKVIEILNLLTDSKENVKLSFVGSNEKTYNK